MKRALFLTDEKINYNGFLSTSLGLDNKSKIISFSPNKWNQAYFGRIFFSVELTLNLFNYIEQCRLNI